MWTRKVHSPKYLAPYSLTPGDVPLPEGTFLLPVCTTRERLQAMMNALWYGMMLADEYGNLEHMIDLLEALAWVQDPTGSPCMPTTGDCYNFTPEMSGGDFQPNNPFLTPFYVPPGYVIPPWYTNPVIPIPGVIASDALVNGASIPLFANIFDLLSSGFPRVRFHVYGVSECEIEFVSVPQGGFALVTTDDNPLTASVVDLSSIGVGSIASLEDILTLVGLGLDLSLSNTTVSEFVFTTDGPHWIDVTFLPNVDAEVIVGFGGGVRRFTRCGPASEGELPVDCGCPEPTNYRYSSSGYLERSYDGGVTWEDASGEDPRFISPKLPPLTTSGDKKCNSAQGAADFIKAKVYDSLSTGSALTLIISAIGAVAAIVLSAGTATPLVIAAAGTIFSAGVASIQAALTTQVWDDFACLIYEQMDDNGDLSESGWTALLNSIASKFTGVAGVTLGDTVRWMGPVGVTNAGRFQREANQDCDSCDAEECGPCGTAVVRTYNYNDAGWENTPVVVNQNGTNMQRMTWPGEYRLNLNETRCFNDVRIRARRQTTSSQRAHHIQVWLDGLYLGEFDVSAGASGSVVSQTLELGYNIRGSVLLFKSTESGTLTDVQSVGIEACNGV